MSDSTTPPTNHADHLDHLDQEASPAMESESTALHTISQEEFKKRSRRSFLVGGATSVAAFMGFRHVQSRPLVDGAPDVLRRGLEFNETVWSGLFRENHLAPTYDFEESSVLRVNGRRGLQSDINLDAWTLRVVGPDGERLGTNVLDDIKALPRYEMTIEHKCIEGWSQITTWAGARLSDFAALYGIERDTDIAYVSMNTPDREYYVGLDMASAMHPQTLLAYDMHGGPLDLEHGAPLRLAVPVKYGIKHIKRIGTIQFTNERPGDFWGDRGYSWYAGL